MKMMNNFKVTGLYNLFAPHILFYSVIYFVVNFFYGAGDGSILLYFLLALVLVLEFIVVVLLASIASSFAKGLWSIRLGVLILWLVCSIYYAQIFSVFISGGSVNQVAIENTEDIQWINSPQLWISLFLHALYLIVASYNFFKACINLKLGFHLVRGLRKIFALIFFGSSFLFVNYSIARSNENLVVHSPVFSLIKAYAGFLTDNPPNLIQKIYFDYFESSSHIGGQYPFETDAIQIQFSKKYDVDFHDSNVIVFFVEGLSSRFISGYGDKYPDLTPNIKKLMDSSLSVDNYFNHTAATFRGLQGQLTSSYPKAHGPADWEGLSGPSVAENYRTLPGILSDRDYATTFINSGNNRLLNMLNAMNFDKVYSGKEAAGEFLGMSFNHSVSDALMMNIMIKFLVDRHSNSETPFFLATYNVGTHAMRDSPLDGAKYGDGKNRKLNRIKHFDAEFGRFLQFFEASKFAQNTILILTADHSTYPEASTIDAGSLYSDYKPYFVDKIPFIIRFPDQKVKGFYDANDRTSLDFAPTILDLLGVSNVKNSFMGSSIFNKSPKYPGALSFIGGDFYYIKNNRVIKELDFVEGDQLIYSDLIEGIRLFNRLESINRVSSE